MAKYSAFKFFNITHEEKRQFFLIPENLISEV